MKTLKINYLAVLSIVVLGQILPMVWYGTFAKSWMKYNNLTEEMATDVGAGPYISSIITSIFFALALAWIFQRMNVASWLDGVKTGFIMGFSFFLLNLMTINFFSFRPYELSWIDGGGVVFVWIVAGAILGGWRKYDESESA